jgi:hypothetical protein
VEDSPSGDVMKRIVIAHYSDSVSEDFHHRLVAGRLFKILEKAKSFPAFDDLEQAM